MGIRSRMRAILEGEIITGPFKHKLGLEMGPPKSEKQRRRELPDHPAEGDVIVHRGIQNIRDASGQLVTTIQWITSRVVGNKSTDKDPEGTSLVTLDSHHNRKKARERALYTAKNIAGRAFLKTNEGHIRLDTDEEEPE